MEEIIDKNQNARKEQHEVLTKSTGKIQNSDCGIWKNDLKTSFERKTENRRRHQKTKTRDSTYQEK